MRKESIMFVAVMALVSALAAGPAAEAGEKARYLVRSSHTPEECLEALFVLKAAGRLSKYEWGCKDGDHTGFAFVRAGSRDEALDIVPESIRAKATATKMVKFTAAEIQKFHDEMKKKQKPKAEEEEDDEEEGEEE